MKWKVPVTWEMYGVMVVEADTIEEAIKKADNDELPLPDGVYVDASFEVSIDHDLIKAISKVGDRNENKR